MPTEQIRKRILNGRALLLALHFNGPMQRKEITPEEAAITGYGGSYAQLQRWTLIPTSSRLGEPVEQALGEGSEFRRVLAACRPGRTAVTIWTYPDSFAAFRRLKQELYRLGLITAARPLPQGVPISGSPQGTKSAAE